MKKFQDSMLILNLGRPLPDPEYLQIRLDDIPEEMMQLYGWRTPTVKSWVYIKMCSEIYGLKQAKIFT